MTRILVIQRQSNVSELPFSLSVQCRILEPLDFLAIQDPCLKYEVCGDNELDKFEGCFFDVLWLNKNVNRRALDFAIRLKNKSAKIIYDLDDWILELPSYTKRPLTEEHVKYFWHF